MLYKGKEIEILSKKSVFGKQIAEVKILSTGEVKSLPFSELSDETKCSNAPKQKSSRWHTTERSRNSNER